MSPAGWWVEVGATATSKCPIMREWEPVGWVSPEHAAALAERLRGQSKGGKARWKGTKKKDRSSAARAAAVARWKTKKADGPQNTAVRHAEDGAKHEP